MRELSLAILGVVLQLAVFFCIGSLLMQKMKLQAEASLAFVFGYLLYFAVFELLAVPMTLLWVPLHILSIVWMILLAVVMVWAVLSLRKTWGRQLQGIPHMLKEHSFLFLVVLAVILVQCAIVVLYQDTTVDATYYVGTVSTSVYTDTLGRYNPFTGIINKYFQARYIFSAYPMHNAVWSQVLGVHPLVQSKVVMSILNVLAANVILYQIGKRLFEGGKKQADLMVCFVCLMQLFSYTIYTTGTFFFTRTYEGKALLGNISVPVVLYCSIWLWQEEKNRKVWWILFFASLCALCFSGSAIIFPVVICAGVLPVILMKKRFVDLVPCAVCMLPTILYGGVYFMTKLGWLTLAAS